MAELNQISLSTRRMIGKSGTGSRSRAGITPGESAARQTSPKQPAIGRRLSGHGKRPLFRAAKSAAMIAGPGKANGGR